MTVIAGQTITIGAVASFLSQWLKKYVPERFQNALVIRCLVALVCVGLNAGGTYLSGAAIDVQMLLEAFLSYLVAAATYDHLFKP